MRGLAERAASRQLVRYGPAVIGGICAAVALLGWSFSISPSGEGGIEEEGETFGSISVSQAKAKDDKSSFKAQDEFSQSRHQAVPAMYGPGGPRIMGLDRCEAYRQSVEPSKRRWAIAGMPNTGTNWLLQLMMANCQGPADDRCNGGDFGAGPERNCSGMWQVPWGKHRSLLYPEEPHLAYTEHSYVLPLVAVKDPLSWMKSMCRHPYGVVIAGGRRPAPCQSPVESASVGNVYGGPGGHASLVHWWTDWIGQYANASLPRLLVRYEDLLFDTKETVGKLCSCVGGELRADFDPVQRTAKYDIFTDTFGRDSQGAQELYGNKEQRYAEYSEADLDFVRRHADPSLVYFFQYTFDTSPQSHPGEKQTAVCVACTSQYCLH